MNIKGEVFHLELATTDAERERGLSGRTSIESHGGMLFVFPRSRVQSFWMADCQTDMDILFISNAGVVVAASEMPVEPPRAPKESREAYEGRLKRYSSRYPVRFVVELAPGTIKRLGIKVTDRIDFDWEKAGKMGK